MGGSPSINAGRAPTVHDGITEQARLGVALVPNLTVNHSRNHDFAAAIHNVTGNRAVNLGASPAVHDEVADDRSVKTEDTLLHDVCSGSCHPVK